MKMRFVSAMIAMCGALALVACKDGGGSGGAGVGGGTGGGTGGTSVTGGTGGTGVTISCMECACDYKSGDIPAGCADTCDNTIAGTPNPNFCNGANALSQCAQCIMDRCGEVAANCL